MDPDAEPPACTSAGLARIAQALQEAVRDRFAMTRPSWDIGARAPPEHQLSVAMHSIVTSHLRLLREHTHWREGALAPRSAEDALAVLGELFAELKALDRLDPDTLRRIAHARDMAAGLCEHGAMAAASAQSPSVLRPMGIVAGARCHPDDLLSFRRELAEVSSSARAARYFGKQPASSSEDAVRLEAIIGVLMQLHKMQLRLADATSAPDEERPSTAGDWGEGLRQLRVLHAGLSQQFRETTLPGRFLSRAVAAMPADLATALGCERTAYSRVNL